MVLSLFCLTYFTSHVFSRSIRAAVNDAVSSLLGAGQRSSADRDHMFLTQSSVTGHVGRFRRGELMSLQAYLKKREKFQVNT